MLRKMKTLVALCSLVAAGSALANPIVLDFEGVGNEAAVLNFYNGGTDSQGHSGTNYGISFGPNALGLIDSDNGGTGNFANEPSASTILFFLSGSAVLNYAAGFDTGFSFYYSSMREAVVNVYSGLNATGDLLGSISLAALTNQTCTGDPNGDNCAFSAAGVAFAGTARSIDFGGTVNSIGFDNITFGSEQPGGAVPEPATLALIGLGLLGTGAARRRSSNRKA